ncbi:uncharacterized protein [Heptranchias perlo]|uniref:uncharacterized protein isoform X2 n=1 Tax=Heptranchias perlo TaxID=212740 RepID=UPI00355A222C
MSAEGKFGLKYLRMSAGGPGPVVLVCALLAGWFVFPTETLGVNIFTSPKHVLVNEDVSLECKITGYNTFDLTNVGVEWHTGPKNQRTMVYRFQAGAHFPKRPGAKMSEAKLKKGDASLHLPKVQFDEEGEYTCSVFVTPEKAEKSAEMQVSAQPVVHLSTQDITILNGSEGSVRCDVRGFYPQQYDLNWEKISKEKTVKITTDICTGAQISNSDGTFDVSSRVRIEPTMDDDGNKYKCTVMHRSLPDGRSLEAKLTVKEPEKSSAVGGIVASIVVTALLCGLLFGAGFYTCIKFKKVSPKISELSKPPILRHCEEAVISCQVTGFRPREIEIVLFLKRKEDQSEKRIFIWCSLDQMRKNKGKPEKERKRAEVQLLMNGYERDASFISFEPECDANSDGTFNVMCNIKMYPDVDKDDGAILTIEVQHKTLRVRKSVTLGVEGVPPKMSKIVVPPHIIHNEPVALTCPISGFKPKPLSITWQQIGTNYLKEIVRLDQHNKTSFPSGKEKYNHYISEMGYEDKTYSITSVLVIVPDIEQDQDTKFICKVQHVCTGSDQERESTLNIQATPKLDPITSEKAIAEEPMTLSCRIHSFYPREITVTWLKNGEKMTEESDAPCEPTLGNDALYYLTSSVKIIPMRANVNMKYTCQVEHDSLTEPVEADWVLHQLVSVPKVTEIIVDPLYPEVGKPVTLSCKAYGFLPEENQIFWFKAFDKTPDGVKTEEVAKDTETGLYSRLSERTFIPTIMDHGKEFKMQILHSETSNKPVSSSHFLKIKGIPFVEDIKFDPPDVRYGMDLALICNISNFSPHPINTIWLQKGKTIFEGITIKGPLREESGCCRLSSCLKVKPTALDFGRDFSFRVEHANLKTPIEKQAFLTLPALSPALSVIKADPELPKVNQLTTLSISLTSYVPDKIQVKWFKNGGIYLDKVINSTAVIADNGLFASLSSIKFIAAEEDNNCSIKCEVLHIETKEVQEKDFKLLIKGENEDDRSYCNIQNDEDFQTVSKITCQTESPKAGQPVIVSCTVKGFTIAESHITWYRDVYPFEDKSFIANTPFETGKGFTTALTYIPRQEDDNCLLQVEITTEMDPVPRYFRLKLS